MSADQPSLAALTEELVRLRMLVATLEQQARESARSERRLLARDAVTRALAESSSLEHAAPRILRAICETLGWEVGALWVVEQHVNLLRCVEVWNSPPAKFGAFETATRAQTFPRGAGMPGRVWATSQPAWIPDVTRDENFPRAAMAIEAGLRSSLGFPIAAGNEVVGVMEFFSREIREPDRELLEMLAALGSQIGQFIERKHAEEVLDRFFTLSLDMLAIAGFDGRFDRLNPAWQRVLGYTVEELTASPFLDFVHPDDRAATQAEMQKLITGGDTISFENRYRARDGSYRWMLWTATPFARDELIYAAARDITDRKLAEERIRRLKEAAEAANRAKSDFLAHMSHEMRTPLTAIIGTSELLDQAGLSAEQQRYVGSLRRASDHLLVLINDLLDLAKVESGSMTLEQVPFSLGEILDKTIEIATVAAREKGVALRCHMAPDVPNRIVGDPNRLRQVLLNLVGNAIKFTHRGEVAIQVRQDCNSADPGALQFAVSDTGVGIPEDKLSFIFESFAQAHASTSREYGGTGLGLAISKNLVELMGGRIWVESAAGSGSTFYFTARFGVALRPCEAAQATVTGHSGQPGFPPAEQQRKILVAEDSHDIRFVIEAYLKNSGHQVEFAANGAIAVEKFRSGRYDLVLMDVQMPVLDGYAATRLMRAWEKERQLPPTPIVALTAYAFESENEKAMAAGCTSYLAKPIRFAALREAVENHVGASCQIHETAAADRLAALVPGYLASRREDLGKLQAALETSDYGLVAEVGHRMSGTGGAYGFGRISEIGDILERAAKQRNAGEIRAQMARLTSFLDQQRA